MLLVLLLVKGSGVTGRAALFVALLPFMTQTVLFEPAWWFAGGLLLTGSRSDPSGSEN